jgi:O-antigen/teichoic acid export membrane protein
VSADNPARPAAMRTDLSSSAGAMARGAARGALGALVASVLALGFQAIVRHIVDIETMGLFTLATTVVVLAQLPALFGLEAGAVRYVSLGAAEGDERQARGAAQAALLAGLVLSTIGMVVLFILAPEICARFHKPEAAHMLRLASLALPLLCASRVCAACVLGFGLTGRSSTITAAQNVTRLLVTVPLVLLISDVTALGLGFAIAGVAGTIFAIWLLRSVSPNILVPARDRWALRSMIGFSWPQTLSQSLYLATLWTDTLVLAHYGTARQVGIYGLVVALLAPVSQLTVSVSQAFTPRIAGTHARGDSAGLASMLQRVSYWNLAVALPILGSMAVLHHPLLTLFSRGYEEGGTPLILLVIGQLVLNAAGPLAAVINLSGHPRVTLFDNALVFGANLVLCIFLVPRYGMTGAATSTLVALCTVTLIQVGQVARLFRIHPFRDDQLRCVLAAGVAATATAAITLLPWPAPLLEVVAGGALFLLVYAGAVAAFGVRAETRELAARARNRVLRRGSTW